MQRFRFLLGSLSGLGFSGSHHTNQIRDVSLLLKNPGPSAVRRLLKLGPFSNIYKSMFYYGVPMGEIRDTHRPAAFAHGVLLPIRKTPESALNRRMKSWQSVGIIHLGL